MQFLRTFAVGATAVCSAVASAHYQQRLCLNFIILECKDRFFQQPDQAMAEGYQTYV